ncbi:MAG: hypothetical protein WB999_14525, partial [Candidatus Binataceae bacterium]
LTVDGPTAPRRFRSIDTTILHASRAAVGNDCSALDHHVDARAVREDRQVVQRVAIDQQEM